MFDGMNQEIDPRLPYLVCVLKLCTEDYDAGHSEY